MKASCATFQLQASTLRDVRLLVALLERPALEVLRQLAEVLLEAVPQFGSKFTNTKPPQVPTFTSGSR